MGLALHIRRAIFTIIETANARRLFSVSVDARSKARIECARLTGGCSPNANNFESLAECTRVCIDGEQRLAPHFASEIEEKTSECRRSGFWPSAAGYLP